MVRRGSRLESVRAGAPQFLRVPLRTNRGGLSRILAVFGQNRKPRRKAGLRPIVAAAKGRKTAKKRCRDSSGFPFGVQRIPPITQILACRYGSGETSVIPARSIDPARAKNEVSFKVPDQLGADAGRSSDQRRTLDVLRYLQQHGACPPGRAAKDRGVATVRTRVRRPHDR